MTIISFGGNAIIRRGDTGLIEEQFHNASLAVAAITAIAGEGPLVITHGNGPVVGNIMLRNETAKNVVPPMPLYICDADSEGGVGFMIQQTLYNALKTDKNTPEIATIVTQVTVNAEDPAFKNPEKPIGPFYMEADAAKLRDEKGWTLIEVMPGAWQRVVASPRPVEIIEAGVIKRLALSGVIVVACGGGGVPVVKDRDGKLAGIDCVIDKDYTTALLAVKIGGRRIVDLTDVDCVYLDFDKETKRPLSKMTATEARSYLDEGHFARGTMGPKITAACEFLEGGGEEVIITSPERLEEALKNEAGTLMVAG